MEVFRIPDLDPNNTWHGFSSLVRSVLCLAFLASVIPQASLAQSVSEYTSSNNGEASIEVFIKDRAPFHIPRTVFGTFLEDIRYSVFGGVSAQLLDNPSFENYPASLETIENRFSIDLFRAPTAITGLPLPWLPLRSTGSRYEPRWGNAPNSCRYLYIMGLPDLEVGIRQKIYLPTQRELSYRGVLFASSVTGPVSLEVSFRKPDQPDAVLAKTGVEVPGDGHWTKLTFDLTLPPESIQPLNPIDFAVSLYGDHRISVDEIRLYPEDAIDGFDPDVIQAAKALHSPLLRYGGNFTSGYHWEDGVGPIDVRPTKLNQSWGQPTYNDFGTDEFMRFCELIGAQAQICLNLGSGTPQEARDWVEYCEGNVRTTEGSRRAANGHSAPYAVAAWEFGNELYAPGQIGATTPEGYATRFRLFYEAVQGLLHPGTLVLATGERASSKWDQQLIEKDGSLLSFLTTHFITRMGDPDAPSGERESIWRADFATPIEWEHRINLLRSELAADPKTRERTKLAVTEWLFGGPHDWNGVEVRPHYPYPRYDNLGGALLAASWLNILLAHADFVPVADMTGLIEFGGIYKRRGVVYVPPQYWAFWLYSNYAGDTPVRTRTTVGEYKATAAGQGRLEYPADVPLLNVLATTHSERGTLTLFVVNQDWSKAIPANVTLNGNMPVGKITARTLTGGSILEGNNEEHPAAIQPTTAMLSVSPSSFHYLFPASSLTVITFDSKDGRP